MNQGEEGEDLSQFLKETQSQFSLSMAGAVTNMQRLFESLCRQVISLKTEVADLRGQLDDKPSREEFDGSNKKIYDNINDNIEEIGKMNNNINDLKDALITGLDKCLKDAGSLARDMVSDIKPTEAIEKVVYVPQEGITPKTSTRKPETPKEERQKPPAPKVQPPETKQEIQHQAQSPQIIQISAPVPTDDISLLERQIEQLNARIAFLESKKTSNPNFEVLDQRTSPIESKPVQSSDASRPQLVITTVPPGTPEGQKPVTPVFSGTPSMPVTPQEIKPSSQPKPTTPQEHVSSVQAPPTNSSTPQDQSQQPLIQTVYIQQPANPNTNELYELNRQIKILYDKISQLELMEAGHPIEQITPAPQIIEKTTEPHIIEKTVYQPQEIPDQILKQIQKHTEMLDNMNKLVQELQNRPPQIIQSESSTGEPISIQLPDNSEALRQLSERIDNCERELNKIDQINDEVSHELKTQRDKLDDHTVQLAETQKVLKEQTSKAKEQDFQNLLNEIDQSPRKVTPPETKPLLPPEESPKPKTPEEEEEEKKEADGLETGDLSDIKFSPLITEREKTPPKKEQAPRPPPPAMASLNTEDLLESFLDATKQEIEKARKAILDETQANLRNLSVQVSGNISKTAAVFDLNFKKVNTKLQDQQSQFSSDMKNHNTEQANVVKELHVADAQISDKIRAIEQRLDAITAAANAPAPKMENIVGEDGKIDLEPVLAQLSAQFTLCQDLQGRLAAIEEKEQVSPTAFLAAVDTLDQQEKKINSVEVMAVATDMKLAELKEIQNEMKNRERSPEDEARYQELREKVLSLEDETKKLRDSMVKFNKDLISCRAAINTLRSHSEVTAQNIEEIRKVTDTVREDTAATDKRLKKVIAFIQNETNGLNNQIKDANRSIERNANRIEEIANRKPPTPTIIAKPADQPESPKTAKSKTSDTPPKPLLPQTDKSLSSTMTSPHQAVIVKPTDELTYVSEPTNMPIQQFEAPPQIVQLPPKVVYEQPVVNVVRKQVEIEDHVQRVPTKSSLPRLKPSGINRQGCDLTRADLRKYDDIFPRLDKYDSIFASLKTAIESLNKSVKNLQDTKADKDALQSLFDQFRLAMGELNNRIGSLRKAIVSKADVSELQQLRHEVAKDIQAQGETAAGTETVRCLLCGNPRHNITGALPAGTDDLFQKQSGPGMSTRINGDGNACFVYGEHGELFYGRSQDGKPIVLKNLLQSQQTTEPLEAPEQPEAAK